MSAETRGPREERMLAVGRGQLYECVGVKMKFCDFSIFLS